ncbi:MAG: adenylyltransferase/cytidyltransferase family protein [Candidatus Heimdallarchaeota archaeon]|nr:adenylyltransferase/cytidyltransferase family protein [Candidatus Heimdallarchaeota archaeon]
MEDLTTRNKEPTHSKKKTFFVSTPPPKKTTKKRILVFGTFDIIHPAHLRFLYEAHKSIEKTPHELVVVLSRDSSIQRIKGHSPVFNEEQRLKVMSCLRLVDYARLGNEGKDYFQVILEVKPDVIVLGYDQLAEPQPLLDFINKHNLSIRLLRLPKYESGDLTSSSEVREKVLEIINNSSKRGHTLPKQEK